MTPNPLAGPTEGRTFVNTKFVATAQASPSVTSPVAQIIDSTSNHLGGVVNPLARSGLVAPCSTLSSLTSLGSLTGSDDSESTTGVQDRVETVHSQGPCQASGKDAIPIVVTRPPDKLPTATEGLSGTKSQISAVPTHDQPAPVFSFSSLHTPGPVTNSPPVVVVESQPEAPPLVPLVGKVSPLRCTRKAIRGKKEWVVFYKSAGSQPLDSPPEVPHAYEYPPNTADLYVHQDRSKGTFQCCPDII
ncbi:hypothetical protein BKA82DRAFT_4020301 [Pisolithus tinctorius]|nr:hypothetical protein BKA82DRAFT_4020301 [Pisolithus tinctorius]